MEIVKKEKCTGCSACHQVCPVNAIEMIADEKGFCYPYVDESKCIHCNKCKKVCSAEGYIGKKDSPTIYAAWNLNEEIRINSTSGGIFWELAISILDEHGVVVGAAYNEEFQIYHRCVENKKQLENLCQSKYAQSDLKNVFQEIKIYLEQERKVLFCGTPCQSAGLQKYLGSEFDQLYTCDFICRGITSPMVYRKYLDDLEKEYQSNINRVHFKNKDWGWNTFSTKITFQDKKVYQKSRSDDLYMRGYLNYNLYIRDCCFKCEYKKIPRVSDITLGDFWGIGSKDKSLDDNHGTSIVMLNSEKGRSLFQTITPNISKYKAELEDVIRGNSCLMDCPESGEFRDYFFSQIQKKTFSNVMEKIILKSLKLSFKEKLFRFIHKGH